MTLNRGRNLLFRQSNDGTAATAEMSMKSRYRPMSHFTKTARTNGSSAAAALTTATSVQPSVIIRREAGMHKRAACCPYSDSTWPIFAAAATFHQYTPTPTPLANVRLTRSSGSRKRPLMPLPRYSATTPWVEERHRHGACRIGINSSN